MCKAQLDIRNTEVHKTDKAPIFLLKGKSDSEQRKQGNSDFVKSYKEINRVLGLGGVTRVRRRWSVKCLDVMAYLLPKTSVKNKNDENNGSS